jgi:hypothetical protein
MKTFIPSVLCAGVFFATGVASLRADPPTATAGKILILEGDRTLEGDVERVGDQYRVRRAVGETWLPANRVLQLCANNADALEYLRNRTNLHDPDERLRLAQWCVERGMQEQAIVEVKAAAELRPNHALTKHLLERLQQQPPNQPPVAPATHADTQLEPAAPVDLTVEALAQFTTKVQPILMNTCAGCHANGRGGSFKLMRVNDGFALNRKTMQQNLAAVIAQVNAQQPQNSRLLTKAVTLHGEMEKTPPLANRQAPAYRALEEWVRLTVENNPQLLDHVVALPSAAPPADPKPAATGFASEHGDAPLRTDGTPKTPAAPLPQTRMTNPDEKPATPESTDPYDPNEFNRQEHPERLKSPPAKKPG